MPNSVKMVSLGILRFKRILFAVITLLVVVFPLITLTGYQLLADQWGKRPYVEEVKQYNAKVKDLKAEYHKLIAQEQGIANQLQAFTSSWSEKDRLKAYQWFQENYKNSRAFDQRYRQFDSEYKKTASRYAEEEKNFMSIDIREEGIVTRQARDILWSAELETLRLRNKAKRAQVLLRGVELEAIKAYEGIYWTDFIYDCLHDMQYILKDYVNNLVDQLYNCFLTTATGFFKNKLLKRPVPVFGAHFGQISWGAQVFGCAKAITLDSIINALEAAVRKQFVDRMEDRGIEPQVAEFWWANYVMPKAAKQTRTQQAFKQFLTSKFWKGQVKQELTIYLQKKLAADIKPGLTKRLKNLSSEQRYGGNAKKLVDSVAKDRASRHTAMKFLEAADFSIQYGERALILYYNQAGFDSIAADLVQRYMFIKQCLKEKKRPAHASAIIGIFQYSQKGWVDFVRDCKKGKPDRLKTISGNWSWKVTCGSAVYNGAFTIGKVNPDGSFSGHFSGTHQGTLRGKVSGTRVTFKRYFGSRVQQWIGTLKGNTITGNLTDPYHPKMNLPTTCQFSANR